MLNSLIIKNFRLFEELTIPELSRLNLILGFNNSGKSCLLEALEIYGSGGSLSTLRRQISMRGEDIENSNARVAEIETSIWEHPFRNIFRGAVFDSEIKIGTKDKRDPLLQISVGPFEDREGLFLMRRLGKKGESYLKLEPDYFDRPLSVPLRDLNPLAHIPVRLVSTMERGFAQLAPLWDRINLTPDLREVVFRTMRIIEPDLAEIVMIGQYNKVVPTVIYRNKANRVPLSSLGDGMNRLFRIIIAAMDAMGGLLLIDELENGIHYTVLPQVFEVLSTLAQEHDIQIFATTHSMDALKAFQALSRASESLRMIRLGKSARKSEEGRLIAQSFDQTEMRLADLATMDLR